MAKSEHARHIENDQQIDDPNPDTGDFKQTTRGRHLPAGGPDDPCQYAPIDQIPDDGFHELSYLEMKKPTQRLLVGLC